jgi:hypothetical protein
MTKWVLKALEPSTSNLHVLLRYRLSNYQPYQGGRWANSLEFFIVLGHQSHNGLMGWNRTTAAWKSSLWDLQYVNPQNIDNLFSCSLWHCSEVALIGPGFSKQRTFVLHKADMCRYRDVLNGNTFISAEAAQIKFDLKLEETGAWNSAIRIMNQKWGYILNTPRGQAVTGEWLGVYPNSTANSPSLVVQAKEHFEPKLGVRNFWIPISSATYIVNGHSATLALIPADNRLKGAQWDSFGEDLESPARGILQRVRVVTVKKGPKKTHTLLFYGQSDHLMWNPNRYQWAGATPIMNYTSELGRRMLKLRHVVPNVVMRKWQGVLPVLYKFRWDNAWNRERIRKEAGLIWLTWHLAVAVNVWRGRINCNIPQDCLVCDSSLVESVLHRFWKCVAARHGSTIFN